VPQMPGIIFFKEVGARIVIHLDIPHFHLNLFKGHTIFN